MLAYLYDQNIAANAVVDLLLDGETGAQNIRFIKGACWCTLAIEADAANSAEVRVLSGSRTVVERSVIDGGGTDGVYPNLNEKAVGFWAADGEILKIEVRETAGAGTVDVMAVLNVDRKA